MPGPLVIGGVAPDRKNCPPCRDHPLDRPGWMPTGPDDPEWGHGFEWMRRRCRSPAGSAWDDDLPPGPQLFLETPGRKPVPAEAGTRWRRTCYRWGHRRGMAGAPERNPPRRWPPFWMGTGPHPGGGAADWPGLEWPRSAGGGMEQCTRAWWWGRWFGCSPAAGVGSQVDFCGRRWEHSFHVPVSDDEGLSWPVRLERRGAVLVESAPAEGSRMVWVSPNSGCNPATLVWTRLDASVPWSGGLWILRPAPPPFRSGARPSCLLMAHPGNW